MKKIALVGPFHQKICDAFAAGIPEGFELIKVNNRDDYSAISDADFIINRTFKLNADDVRNAKKLKLVQKWGAGYDNIDAEGIGRLDIPVAVCSGINAQPVAELAVLHMLAVLRNITALNTHLKNNLWPREEYISRSYLLGGRVVGLVGLGNIGKKVAALVQAFGCRVVYYDPFRVPVETEKTLDVEYLPLDGLLKIADVVSLHLPLTSDTKNLIDYAKLSIMKPTAILINTSRGGIVDENDLARAIAENKIMGAGLDALACEPIGQDSPLIGLERVNMTPHIGGNTVDNDGNMVARCLDNILRIDKGCPLRRKDLVNLNSLTTKMEVEE